MPELKEIRIDSKELLLQDNIVRGPILPERIADLTRTVTFRGNNVVEGAICAQRIIVKNGPLDVEGAVFTQNEFYVDNAADGEIIFRKCVASSNSVVSRATRCRLTFASDVNAKSVTLRDTFVAGSIYADEVTLDNCVVIGGVFGTQEVTLNNCIVGTFNTPVIRLSGIVQLLLPSAFSVEPAEAAPGTQMYNLSLADLGDLYRGQPQDPQSGRIPMDFAADQVTSHLVGEDTQQTLRSYTVVGRVLAADLINTDRFQNHFLLTAAALNGQLQRTYDLGRDAEGHPVELSLPKLRAFFFDVLSGRVTPQDLTANFDLLSVAAQQ